MGNRANVIFVNKTGKEISSNVYLHWNGGASSIYAFLDELDIRHVRADQNYECARFIQIVGEYFDQDSISSLSLGVVNGPKKITIEELDKVRTDSGDNGFYIVCREGGERVVRRFIDEVDGLRELSKEEVEMERQLAYKHDYIVGENNIPDNLKKIRNGRKIEA